MIFTSIFQAFYHLHFEFLESFYFLDQNYDKETLIPEQIKNRTILIRTISRDPYHPLNSTLKIIFIFPRSKKKKKKTILQFFFSRIYTSFSFDRIVNLISKCLKYTNKFDYQIIIIQLSNCYSFYVDVKFSASPSFISS